MGLVGRAVVAEHPSALDPLAVEPGHSTAQEAHCCRPLLVSQYLDVGQPRGVIHRDMDPFVAGSGGASFAWVAGDPVANAVEPGQLFDVDMDHVAGLLPLVSLHRRSGLQVTQPVQPQAPHHPGQGADRHQQQPGDPPEGPALVPEVGAFYWTASAPDIVSPGREEQGSLSV